MIKFIIVVEENEKKSNTQAKDGKKQMRLGNVWKKSLHCSFSYMRSRSRRRNDSINVFDKATP